MPGKDLCLLALDGGGIRGLSSLQILKQLMESINPQSPPKPCDYFDMIGGTSTGGLLAIMLGRLRMTIDDCIDAYVSLSDRVFQKTRQAFTILGYAQGRFDSKELENAMKQIIVEQGLEMDALLEGPSEMSCKVFVCAMRKEIGKPVRLRSYRSRRGDGGLLRPKIWEAGRATSAASSFFDPIKIGVLGQEFVDGASGANNPVYELWTEAQDIWGEAGKFTLEDRVKCLVSIGTGRPSLRPFGDHFIDIGRSLIAISMDTEKTAENFVRDKRKLYMEGRYYRFNVERGLENIRFEDSYQKNTIISATSEYLESQDVYTRIQSFSMISKHSTTLIDTEASYIQAGLEAYKAKEWTQAITLLKQALEGRDYDTLEDDGIATTRQYYAQALYCAGQYELARVEFQTLVVWAENRFGKENIKTLQKRMSWGYALHACSLSSLAREQFRIAALGFEQASNGADTLDSLRCRYMHGLLASEHKAYDRNWFRWPEAEESLRRAAQGFARMLKPEEREAFDAQMGYATVLLKMCRDQDACNLFRRLLLIAKQKGAPQNEETIKKIKCNIEECEFWLSQPAAIRSADRLPLARKRAEEQLKKASWRDVTGHWSKG